MKRLIAVLVTLTCLFVPTTALAAYNPLSQACQSGNSVNTSAGCTAGTDNPIVGPNGILKKVSLVLAFISGVMAVIIIMVSGFNYVTSGGDAKKAEGARNGIVGAAVGLVIIAGAETIVIFVISKL
ncbi:MAG TPA: hypothetical protein VLG92_00795 [Candidatus Saccharimonadia bacterium]|nr:hypothetical protein [Candidatus Saccharimonadia bacterium]